MNTDMIFQMESSSSDDTSVLGEKLGRICKGGETFLLVSDLGGGKTTFTKGLGKGLGCKEVITSPTFTVSNIYKCHQGIELHHYDFYRLSVAGIMSDEISEDIGKDHIVTIIEWGDLVSGVLPESKVVIEFSRVIQGEDIRSIKITIPESYKYLQEALK